MSSCMLANYATHSCCLLDRWMQSVDGAIITREVRPKQQEIMGLEFPSAKPKFQVK